MRERKILIEKLSQALGKKEFILFAYVFGSFRSENSFKDIDIGMFVRDDIQESPLGIEIAIESELQTLVGLPFDVRILNSAPLSFVYQVIRDGILVVDKEIDLRSDYESLICRKYFDFCHLRNEYLREVADAPL